MAPLISVIVPVYMAEDTLRNCVDSILKQTNRDFELLLIDDGSPDSCRDICDTYAAKDARVRVWHKENGGVSTARNLGLEVACGEWIAFVDADDSVDEGFFDVLKEGLGYDLVIGGYKTLPKGEIYYNFEGAFKGDTMGDFVARHLWNGYVWGKFYKTSILREHRIVFRTDLVVYEDLLFNLDYILQCNSIKLVPLCLYLYMDPPGKMIQEKYAEIDLNELKPADDSEALVQTVPGEESQEVQFIQLPPSAFRQEDQQKYSFYEHTEELAAICWYTVFLLLASITFYFWKI